MNEKNYIIIRKSSPIVLSIFLHFDHYEVKRNIIYLRHLYERGDADFKSSLSN